MPDLRVFISSTFQDLQEEREHLVKKIFPEIRALCRERGITFTEVDLRWGLTDEQLALGQVIRTCLEEVDKCRPYFIGITGDRYGYVPTYLDVQKDPALLKRHPWIEDVAIDGMSITEMEAHYAVLNPSTVFTSSTPLTLQGRAHFYLRRYRESLDDAHTSNDEQAKLEAYHHRIRQSGVAVDEFRDPVSLGELIYDDLLKIIKQDFADARPPTPLEQERARHEAFSLSRRRAYIANPAYLKRLDDHAASDDPPLVVYAESGSGKSSLFAYWAEQYCRKHPGAHVIEHYVGIGATATDHYAVIRHVCMEINELFGRDEEIPSDPAKLETALGQWLGYADHGLRKAREDEGVEQGEPDGKQEGVLSLISHLSSLIIIIDGLNQLQGTALNLQWIPDVISPSIRIILSSTVEESLVVLRKRGWSEFGMQALTEAERETIIVRYLAEYSKSLLAEQINRIATDYKCGHPLFLKTLLEELRIVGRHQDLDATIAIYLDATGTEDLFQRVLERLEADYSTHTVRDVMSLMGASRSGLDERELSEVSGISRLKIATMVAGLDYHLVRKEGRLTFFHDYLRRAIEKRYLNDEQTRCRTHVRLAEYFERSAWNHRNASERMWQYAQAGNESKLMEMLGNLAVLRLLYVGAGVEEVLTRWARLRENGHDPEAIYRASLEEAGDAEASEQMQSLQTVELVLENLSLWSGAIEICRRLLVLSSEQGSEAERLQAEVTLGRVLQLRGEYAEAMEHLEHARHRYEEIGDRSGISGAIGIMGNVYATRGENDRALECYRRKLAICEEIGDRNGVAFTIGNMGLMYSNRGENDRALECYQRMLEIHGAMGNCRGVAFAIGGMGVVHYKRGEYDRALECYQCKLTISEKVGDRNGVASAMGNIGNVYSNRGEYDQALERFQQQLTICEELRDLRGVAVAIQNMGLMHVNHGENDQALEYFQRQKSICERLGDLSSLSVAIGSIGLVYANRGENDQALECYQRQLTICEELGDRCGASISIGNMGNVYVNRGENDRALECYERSLQGHREIGFRYGLTYWLSGRARVLLKCVELQAMPEYLPKYLPGISEVTWRVEVLRSAREDTDECRAISEELSKPDTLFSSSILLARLEAIEGDRDGAVDRLRVMLDDADNDGVRAELHYRLWKLTRTEEHRAETLRLNEVLHDETPKPEYRRRIEELKAAATTEQRNAAE